MLLYFRCAEKTGLSNLIPAGSAKARTLLGQLSGAMHQVESAPQ